jgi:hypothetical protein
MRLLVIVFPFQVVPFLVYVTGPTFLQLLELASSNCVYSGQQFFLNVRDNLDDVLIAVISFWGTRRNQKCINQVIKGG